MNVRYESETTAVRLDKAILLYSGNDGGSKFATLHDVTDGAIQAGTPLDNADVEELFRNDGKRPAGVFLPGNVLEYSHESIIWYARQTTAPIYFNATSTESRKMNAINGKPVRWPALLFRLSRQSFQCWALNSDKRPELATELCRAPLWNVSDNGGVCMPSGIREKLWSKNGIGNISLETMQKMQEAFYLSAFSHPSGSGIIIKGGHNVFWMKATGHPKDKFPAAALVKTKHKLKDILK
jgi:PRTRC genetic system protein B